MTPKATLTQEEADRMLHMLKHSLTEYIEFPTKGTSIEFDLLGDSDKYLFTTKIYRGKINRLKYDIGARIKKDGILLLELHINPGNTHINPDGTKIIGSHWHIYTEEYDRKFAVTAEDIESDAFVDNTVIFLKNFHVIDLPSITFQMELV